MSGGGGVGDRVLDEDLLCTTAVEASCVLWLLWCLVPVCVFHGVPNELGMIFSIWRNYTCGGCDFPLGNVSDDLNVNYGVPLFGVMLL